MDKDEKLLVFLDSLGQDADVDFARQMLEASDWDVEAALNMITGGDTAAPAAAAAGPLAATSQHLDYVDEDGIRAPMRTGYRDTLLGPSPEDVFERAAAHSALGAGGAGREFDPEAFAHLDADSGDGHRRSHRSDETLRSAMRASQAEYQRVADQREQGALADALQASYADYNVAEQSRHQRASQDQSEEDRLMAQAIEASFKDQCGADAQYRAQLERAVAASASQDTAAAPSGRSTPSGRSSPTGIPHVGSSRAAASAAAPGRPSASASSATAAARQGVEHSTGATGSSRRPERPSAATATRQPRPPSGDSMLGQPPSRHVTDARANAAAQPSLMQARPARLSRGGSNGASATAGEVPAPVAIHSRLHSGAAQRSTGSGRSDDAPGNRGSSGRGVPPARSAGSGTSAASVAARPERQDSASSAGTKVALGAAAREQGGAADLRRPAAPPGVPLPTAPPPPASGSRSTAGTPPNVGPLRHGVEEADYVMKGAREPRNVLMPLNVARAPGQDAAVQGLRDAVDADRRRFPTDEKRMSREADLRRREATREVEQQQQLQQHRDLEAETERRRRDLATSSHRAAEAEAERQRRAAEGERRASAAAAEAAECQAQDRRRREETEQQRRRDEVQELRRNEEKEAGQRAEEAKRRRLAEAEAAAVEAERKKREAEEFEIQRAAAEVEARKRDAIEAEELAKERRDAEDRRREAEKAAQPEEKEKESSELVTALVALRRRYKEDPEGLATCLKTLGTYVRNLANNPHEPKYQRINTENGAFQKRVAVYEGSTAVLAACGFHQDGASLVCAADFLKTKGPRLFDALAKIDVLVEQLKR